MPLLVCIQRGIYLYITTMKRPIYLYMLFTLHLILVISAIAGSTMMIYKPDGSLLGLELSRLQNTPFSDYLLPGLILLVSNGLFSLFALIGLVFEPSWKKVGFLICIPTCIGDGHILCTQESSSLSG
jgi:hypothetical protein